MDPFGVVCQCWPTCFFEQPSSLATLERLVQIARNDKGNVGVDMIIPPYSSAARSLLIEEKVKPHLGVVRPSDFRVSDGGPIDPQIVLRDPNVSLYCLDFEKECALFVDTPDGADLLKAPFLYTAQYEAATRLIQIPFKTLHQLADEVVIDSSSLIFVHSVGRCGSTLVSRAFGEMEGVESLSEPDVATQMLAEWGCDHLAGQEKLRLLRSCTLIQCAPGKIRNVRNWVFKFRSMVTVMGPLFFEAFPESKAIFLYREGTDWIKSFLRMVGSEDPVEQWPVSFLRDMFGRGIAFPESTETASALEIGSMMWASTMASCRGMQQDGLPLFLTRYEELNTSPREVLNAMFAYCDLSDRAIPNLELVLGSDSQAGSKLSRENLSTRTGQLTQQHLDDVRRMIAESGNGIKAETILPNTYFPDSTSVQ